MKLGLAQVDVQAGNPRKNLEVILQTIEEARLKDVKILIFSEMVVSGYLLGDEWENKSFTKELMNANETIRKASEGMTLIWGNLYVDKDKKGEDGRERKYNSAFIASNKKWIDNGVFEGRTYKTLMPKYREFDDERHFYSLNKEASDRKSSTESLLQPFEVTVDGETIKLGLILCEDMWSDDYNINPSKILVENGAEMIINLSCSPWTWRKNTKRHSVVKSITEETKVPFLYCNNVGIQNNGKNIFLFDGNSTVYNSKGEAVLQTQDYKQELLVFEYDAIKKIGKNSEMADADSDISQLYKGIVFGIRKFLESLPNKKVVIGLSGGIDSAVVATLIVDAVGPENLLAVNMPSKFNSDITKSAAEKLAENLKIEYKVVPIQESVDWTIKQLADAGLSPNDFVIENIQARDRGSRILASIAATVGGIFTNNGNKTETALGYCTLYGDVDGAFSPIGDIYKGQVYALAKYINKIKGVEVIPDEVIKVVPSAELSDKQDVAKGLGDPMNYPYHDKLIRAFVEYRMDPTEILEMYDDKTISSVLDLPNNVSTYFDSRDVFISDLEHKWKLYKTNIFKRVQAPPILAVSKRAFGFDLREALNSAYFTDFFTKKALDNSRA